jgi:hypothetical protein
MHHVVSTVATPLEGSRPCRQSAFAQHSSLLRVQIEHSTCVYGPVLQSLETLQKPSWTGRQQTDWLEAVNPLHAYTLQAAAEHIQQIHCNSQAFLALCRRTICREPSSSTPMIFHQRSRTSGTTWHTSLCEPLTLEFWCLRSHQAVHSFQSSSQIALRPPEMRRLQKRLCESTPA